MHTQQINISINGIAADKIKQSFYQIKMVFNDNGAILFDVKSEHRDNKRNGISYEDDGKGNALAALINQDKVEIRLHKDFSAERVTNILRTLIKSAELNFLKNKLFSYGAQSLQV